MMQKNITVAKSWYELNQWQIEEIAHLYLNTPADIFSEAYLKMIFVVFQKSPKLNDRISLQKLLSQVPIHELEHHTQWLLHSLDYYSFPEIPGLIAPLHKAANITIRQFSTIDLMFHHWHKEKSEINLKKLVASLYRINEKYDDLDLTKVDAITRNLPIKKLETIALAYLFTRIRITELYPIVFPKPKEKEDEIPMPVFTKKEQYIPFDKSIIAMAMDELQPLGKKQDIDQVRIYEFFPVLTESILYHRNKTKSNEGK